MSGNFIYDCVLNFSGNPVTTTTSLQLRHVRGVLSIPNVVTGINDTLSFIYGVNTYMITFPQGYYNLTEYCAALATRMTAAVAVPGEFTAAPDLLRGIITLTTASATAFVFTSQGTMAQHRQFAVFPLLLPMSSQRITGAWLFLTRTVSVAMPELTRMQAPPTVGNMPSQSMALVVLEVGDPSAPVFYDQDFDLGSITLPMNYDDRISATSVRLTDDTGRSLSAYCAQESDWLLFTFVATR
jgi:hypothetical protein